MRKTTVFLSAIAISAAALTAGAITPTLAQGANGSGAVAAQNRAGNQNGAMDIPAVIERLQGLGYTDIREVEREHNHYEVEASNHNGKKVELKLNAKTGEIISEERD